MGQTMVRLQGRLIYGQLVVQSVRRDPVSHRIVCVCVCSCGRITTPRRSDLDAGKTVSCGCAQAHPKHNMLNTRTYYSWQSMRKRCYYPKHEQYPNYGGRGIRVCERWLSPRDGFAAFVADMGLRPPGMTLDRRDPNGDYEPGNCRWATSFEQAHNKRAWAGKHSGSESYEAEMAYWDEQERLAGLAEPAELSPS